MPVDNHPTADTVVGHAFVGDIMGCSGLLLVACFASARDSQLKFTRENVAKLCCFLLIERVRQAGTGFRSLTAVMDTTTSAGRMVMQMLGSFAEFERSMVRERTRAGLAAARDRGVKVGRPAKLSPHQQQEIIRTVREGSKTTAAAARLFGLHRSNVTRLLARADGIGAGRANLRN
jgi:DNA invertase Pin-like site-specific DNA recombinase